MSWRPNAERYLRPLYRLARIYPTELLLQTQAIAERCTFSLDELRYEYPEEIVPPGETPACWLRRATYEESRRRYPDGMPEKVKAIVDHELALIADLQYEPYFLTVYDIVRYARSQGILCQGRGSAANSAVCYCLGITEVDPVTHVGAVRALHQQGAQRAARHRRRLRAPAARRSDAVHLRQVRPASRGADGGAAHVPPQGRAARRRQGARAVARPGRPAGEVARHGGTAAASSASGSRKPASIPTNPVIVQLAELAAEVIGFPRHLSQHSGGFVIARDRLDRMVPIENAAMDERTVIQWDKDDLDALGLLKIDVLALGMLCCIRRALDHIGSFSNRPLRLQDIPSECPKVYDMLCHGDSLGVFQVESRAQMNMLPRLAPRCFYDLVIETAIVRPGPIQGGMVHPYLRRRQKLEPVTYPSEAVKAVLERTLGVSIFQEQVMQLAVVAAGFTPGEADKLRRAMAAWKRKGGIGPFRDKLISGMLARGYTADYAEQIYKQIKGFGEYGFPESHAASFGLLVYVSSWLKCHEPAAFCAALLDSQPLGFYAPAQIVRDAMNHGVEVRPDRRHRQRLELHARAVRCRSGAAGRAPRPRTRRGPATKRPVNASMAARRRRALRRRAGPRAARAAQSRRDQRAGAGRCARHADRPPPPRAVGHARRRCRGAAHRAARREDGGRAAVDLLPPTEGQDIVADYHHTVADAAPPSARAAARSLQCEGLPVRPRTSAAHATSSAYAPPASSPVASAPAPRAASPSSRSRTRPAR